MRERGPRQYNKRQQQFVNQLEALCTEIQGPTKFDWDEPCLMLGDGVALQKSVLLGGSQMRKLRKVEITPRQIGRMLKNGVATLREAWRDKYYVYDENERHPKEIYVSYLLRTTKRKPEYQGELSPYYMPPNTLKQNRRENRVKDVWQDANGDWHAGIAINVSHHMQLREWKQQRDAICKKLNRPEVKKEPLTAIFADIETRSAEGQNNG